MRNNPFITVILLIFINILLYLLIVYINPQLLSSESFYSGFIFIFLFFSTPVTGILISIFIKDILHRKEIRKFSIFLLIATLLIGGGLAYFGAVAKSFQH